jgi:hypothetical protein
MSIPPGQPPNPSDHQHGQDGQPAKPSRRPAWPRRHPVWSTLIAGVGLLVVIGAALSPGPGPTKASSTTAAPSPSPSIAPAAALRPLKCGARANTRRPADHTTVKVRVHTVAHAEVTVSSSLAFLSDGSATGRASAGGTRTLRLRVGDARPGAFVVVSVRVSRHGRRGSCQVSLQPKQAPTTTVAAPTQPAPAPASSPSPPPATGASCYPLSDEGTCYEPGEFCRDDDQGMSGIAGDGEAITCEDNDGWRWEPA